MDPVTGEYAQKDISYLRARQRDEDAKLWRMAMVIFLFLFLVMVFFRIICVSAG